MKLKRFVYGTVRVALYAALFVALAALPANAGKKPQQAFQTIPDQVADIGAGPMATAKQKCENWALAAGLETMLRQQGIALDQSFWVMRLNLGELCVNTLPSMDALASVVNRDFVLDDGRHVQLAMHYAPGTPRTLTRSSPRCNSNGFLCCSSTDIRST